VIGGSVGRELLIQVVDEVDLIYIFVSSEFKSAGCEIRGKIIYFILAVSEVSRTSSRGARRSHPRKHFPLATGRYSVFFRRRRA
jgi:hypothetical protein